MHHKSEQFSFRKSSKNHSRDRIGNSEFNQSFEFRKRIKGPIL